MSAEAARRDDALRLVGSGGANRVMEAELLRLVKRSPFHVRVPAPKRDGDSTLVYPFAREIAWVAAVYHRSSSRVTWDLWSSPADRLEPLFADLVPLVAGDDRLDLGERLPLTVEVRAADDFEAGPLQLRGVVKNALVEGLAKRGVEVVIDEEAPRAVVSVRRTGPEDARRTTISLDVGGGPRHVRGERVAMVDAPLRETLAAQLVLLSRWDARSEPLVDPMAGGATIAIEAAHLAVGHAVRDPRELLLARHPAFDGLPLEAPDLFPGTQPRILSCDREQSAIPSMIGNMRAAGLTGPAREKWVAVRRVDVLELTPEIVGEALRDAPLDRGVFCVNPPYGVRLAAGESPDELLGLYREMGRMLGRFPGWRALIFVANPGFVGAFSSGFGREPVMVKPASNADLRGWFYSFE